MPVVFGKLIAGFKLALNRLFCLAAVSYTHLDVYKRQPQKWDGVLGALVFLALFFAFGLFTFFPPSIGLFQDPATGGYGVG